MRSAEDELCKDIFDGVVLFLLGVFLTGVFVGFTIGWILG